MALSVNTNVGAMIALQSLGAINAEMAQVQNRISTGLKVASPKDNPAVWAIAQNQRAESKALDAVQGSLQRGQSAAQVALTAGESISDLVSQMKTLALQAMDYPVGSTSRAAINEDYLALRKQIDLTASNATFDGINLVAGGGSTSSVRALANSDASSTIDIAHADLSMGGTALSGLPADLTGVVSSADIDAISDGVAAVNSAVSKLGTGAKALDTHLIFVGKLQDTIDEGVGRLVDADLAKESARLQALQVKMQLTMMSLQIANQAPSLILQLFQRRG
jgi:flagellin